jgi:hypothetical protein
MLIYDIIFNENFSKNEILIKFSLKMLTVSCYNEKFEKLLGPINNEIRNKGFILGGSTVISVITDDEYIGSDFDIYVNYSFKKKDFNIDSDFDRWIVKELGGVLILNKHYQEKSYKYICPKFTINIIITGKTTREEIIEYIQKTSDLDICMSTYDGFNTRFIPMIFCKKGSVINSNLVEDTFETNLVGRERELCFLKFNKIFEVKRKTRCVKYIQRGFTISGCTLDIFDYHRATIFINNQYYVESTIRRCINFIAHQITEFGFDGKSLDDILHGSTLFPFKYEIPIICIHHELTFEFYPWARKWQSSF